LELEEEGEEKEMAMERKTSSFFEMQPDQARGMALLSKKNQGKLLRRLSSVLQPDVPAGKISSSRHHSSNAPQSQKGSWQFMRWAWGMK
jgi:hypothetical protein